MDKSKDESSALPVKPNKEKSLRPLWLGTGMVYLTAAAKTKSTPLGTYPEAMLFIGDLMMSNEQFDDALIEAHQLVSMTDWFLKSYSNSHFLQQHPKQ